jgi:lipopolysaccharide export system protein LptC
MNFFSKYEGISYSRAVFFTKNTLAILSVLLLILVVALPYFNPSLQRITLVMEQVGMKTEKEKTVMQNPRLEGIDENHQPYQINALEAAQIDKNKMLLTSPSGELMQKDGNWISVNSMHGAFHNESRLLDLSGDVNLYTGDGYHFFSEHVKVDVKNNVVTSDVPVEVQGLIGTITAQNFLLRDRGKYLRFEKQVHVHYITKQK